MPRDAAPGIVLLTVVPGLLFVMAPKMFQISYVYFFRYGSKTLGDSCDCIVVDFYID